MRVLILFLFLSFSVISLHAEIRGRSPLQVEVIESDASHFEVVCDFKYAIVKTYFEIHPFNRYITTARPYWQEFHFLPTGEVFESSEWKISGRSYYFIYRPRKFSMIYSWIEPEQDSSFKARYSGNGEDFGPLGILLYSS